MGFFERDVIDGLDELFDLNKDGKLDIFEESLQMEFICGESEDSNSCDEE